MKYFKWQAGKLFINLLLTDLYNLIIYHLQFDLYVSGFSLLNLSALKADMLQGCRELFCTFLVEILKFQI